MTAAKQGQDMSERLQAYLQLVQALLECPAGEEQAVLQANQDLLDIAFIQVLDQIVASAEQEEQQEIKQAAEFLKQISAGLKQALQVGLQLRLQKYQELVAGLLNCPEGKERELLEAHRDLWDIGLLEVLGQTAGSLVVRGQSDAANFLLYWVQEIGLQIGLYERTSTENTPQSAGRPLTNRLQDFVSSLTKLWQGDKTKTEDQPEVVADAQQEERSVSAPYGLMRLLQVIADHQQPPLAYQLCYQMVAQQQLQPEMGQALRQWAEAVLPQLSPAQRLGVARDIASLGCMFMGCPVGDISTNLELAITAMEIALCQITDDIDPKGWAQLHHNLAICYSDRQLGNKAENQEHALKHYQYCLQVYNRNDYPEDWAMLQNNLGLLYRDRISEEKAVNLELAIVCFQAALEVHTPQSNPRLWAVIHTNLAQTYELRQQGDRVESLERALHSYRQALSVLTTPESSAQRRQVEQMLVLAESKLLAEKKRAMLQLTANGLVIGQTILTLPELVQSLVRYNLLYELVAGVYVDNLIAEMPYTEGEYQQGCQLFEQLVPADQRNQWLSQRGITEATLPLWLTRGSRIERLKKELFAHKLESYFLERKTALTRLRYYFIRHPDPDLVKELYFRVQDPHQDIELLASEYGQGEEAIFGGLIGPVELGQLPPALAQLLQTAKTGDTIGPLNLGQEWGLIHIKQVVPAQLNQTTERRLLDELFDEWLKTQLKEVNPQLVEAETNVPSH